MSLSVNQLNDTANDNAYLTLHKFGGSSLANPECYLRVAKLLLEHSEPADLVVVSAAGKTTNHLLALIELAKTDASFESLFTQLSSYQRELIQELLSEPKQILALLNDELEALDNWLRYESIDQYTTNSIVACGEVWSSRLLAAVLNEQGRQSCAIDSRKFLVARGDISPNVDEDFSQQLLKDLCCDMQNVQRVITGFICRDMEHHTLTLGRNGSDYSATLIAQIAGAQTVNIWTDVAGVFSADPNVIKEAVLIEQLSLIEAEELARLGNPVLHRRTLQPLAKDNMALRVRSSFTPKGAFTEIGRQLGHVGDCIVNGSQHVNVYTFDINSKNRQVIERLDVEGFFPLVLTEHNNLFLLVIPKELANNFESYLSKSIKGNYNCDSNSGVISLLDAGVSWHRELFSEIFVEESDWPIVLSDNELSLSVIIPAVNVITLTSLLHQKIYQPTKLSKIV